MSPCLNHRGLATVSALLIISRRMNRVMHANGAEYDIIPNDQNLIAQYLLLYEMSGDPENLWKVVDGSFSTANVTLQLKKR